MILIRYPMINAIRLIHFAVILTAIFSLTACLMRPVGQDHAAKAPAGVPENVSQILLVKNEGFLFFTTTRLYALEKRDASWLEIMPPFAAVIGRKGFAPPGEKREGDGRTPSGLYRLGAAFGYAPSVLTKMPYRQSLADDLWIDDPNDPDYNRLVKQEKTRAASFEKMKREDDLYKYGMIIEYNTDPVVKGHGSAIFLHIWSGPRSETAGCVAVSENDLLKILAWLDPAANPVILLNPDAR